MRICGYAGSCMADYFSVGGGDPLEPCGHYVVASKDTIVRIKQMGYNMWMYFGGSGLCFVFPFGQRQATCFLSFLTFVESFLAAGFIFIKHSDVTVVSAFSKLI